MRNLHARFDLSDTPSWSPRRLRAPATQLADEHERELDEVLARLSEEDRITRRAS